MSHCLVVHRYLPMYVDTPGTENMLEDALTSPFMGGEQHKLHGVSQVGGTELFLDGEGCEHC